MTDFQPKTPAVFVGVDVSGVTHYRVMLPAQELQASMFVRTVDLDGMKLVGDVEAPVAIYSMPRSLEMIDECIQILANPKRALIVDIDDCLRAVVEQGEHPSVGEWADLLDKHEWLLARAAAVTCTTPFLADYARSCGQTDVHVIPNALDIGRWNHRREPRHKEFTIIGWSGSIGHEAALQNCVPELEALLRRRDDVAIASVGRPVSRLFPDDLKHRFHDIGYVPLYRHPQVLTQFHINIGPTLDNDFYAAKSDLRALEAMASDTLFIGGGPTYADVWRKSGGIVFAEDPEQMVDFIELAILNSKWNVDVRKKGGKWVRENRLIEHTAPLWENAINSVLP